MTSSSSKPSGRMFWVDQPHGAKCFPGDRPMAKVLVVFVGGWAADHKNLADYRQALLDAAKRVDELIQQGHV